MNFLRHILEKGAMFLFVLTFSFVSLYVPQIFTPDKAEAGGMVGGALETTQWLNNFELLGVNGFTSISAAADPITAGMTGASFALDNVADGVAWALAKGIASEMTSSILNWVNSGFKGSPAFITDLEGFLTEVADRTIGGYLDELGGPFSFLCAPFKLDIQVAVAIVYENERANAGQVAPPTCTLSGALTNLEDFIDGVQSFTDGDGWDKWFKITANPSQYTPQGSMMAAQAQAKARIVNARGQEMSVAAFGQGFLSSKVCEAIEGSGTKKEKCTITTPGKVISSSLNEALSLGGKTLVEADEINEIITAVFTQLQQKAITGAMGLLGLSGNTGYTYTGTPFTEDLATSGLTSNPNRLRTLVTDSLALENEYKNVIDTYRPQLVAYALNITHPADRIKAANEAATDALDIKLRVEANIGELELLRDEFDAMMLSGVKPDKLQEISEKYFVLPLHSEAEIQGSESLWKTLLRDNN
jgi:HAMP domain-containing protein